MEGTGKYFLLFLIGLCLNNIGEFALFFSSRIPSASSGISMKKYRGNARQIPSGVLKFHKRANFNKKKKSEGEKFPNCFFLANSKICSSEQ